MCPIIMQTIEAWNFEPATCECSQRETDYASFMLVTRSLIELSVKFGRTQVFGVRTMICGGGGFSVASCTYPVHEPTTLHALHRLEE